MLDGNEVKQKGSANNERGKGFPRLSLANAVGIIEKASKYGRNWSREQFASFGSKAGKGSATSGAFRNRLAALQDFDFVNLSGDVITRTELADRIVKPIKPEEKEESIRDAFLKVDIFKKIIETVEKDVDLDKSDIAEMAVKQLGVSRNAKDAFVSSFVESGKFAGFVVEVDKNTIRIVISPSPSIETVDQENVFTSESSAVIPEKPNVVQTLPHDLTSTTFGVRRAGKTWDIGLQIRSSKDIESKLTEKIIKLLQNAEEVAKLFKEEEVKDDPSNNQSQT